MSIIDINCLLSPRFPVLYYAVSVPEVAKEAYETTTEELHEVVCGCALSCAHCAGCCQARHQMVGIDVVCVEHGKFAACLVHYLLPYFFPVLQLQHYRMQFRLGFYGTSRRLVSFRCVSSKDKE